MRLIEEGYGATYWSFVIFMDCAITPYSNLQLCQPCDEVIFYFKN